MLFIYLFIWSYFIQGSYISFKWTALPVCRWMRTQKYTIIKTKQPKNNLQAESKGYMELA